ncbi:hypothetical protein AB0I61_17180 [Polymorphospora rubra]|uniref:hypothetical protein n=1 Tax=Polymorphospora rubra TaxID=338584 RepID=UPI0033E9FB3D
MTITDAALADVIAKLTGTTPAPAAKPWCQAGCGERLDPILVTDPATGGGLHLGCEPPAVDLAPEPPATGGIGLAGPPAAYTGTPPSTVGELRQMLIDFEANRPRTRQKALGPSELGTPCQQQIARKLAGAPRRPITAPTWAPFAGTAVHASMEDVVAFWNAQLGRERWLAEDRLVVHEGVPGVDGIAGNGDAFDTDHDMVVDWKYVGKTALNKLRRAKAAGRPPAEQVSAEYRVQGHLYGLGHERKGRTVRHVRLVLLARSHDYDESAEWTEPYQPDIAIQALDRYFATVDLLDALNVAEQPEFITGVPATPSADACKWCPFHRPGQPAGWAGCAGDTAAQLRRVDTFTDGLIAPKTP